MERVLCNWQSYLKRMWTAEELLSMQYPFVLHRGQSGKIRRLGDLQVRMPHKEKLYEATQLKLQGQLSKMFPLTVHNIGATVLIAIDTVVYSDKNLQKYLNM